MKFIIILIFTTQVIVAKTYLMYAKFNHIADTHILQKHPKLKEHLTPRMIAWLNKYDLEHTYICIDGENDCRSIAGYGIAQGQTQGGEIIESTVTYLTEEEHCAADIYTRHDINNPCDMDFYGIQGTCHQFVNRGLFAKNKGFLTIDSAIEHIGDSTRLSYTFWGVYGLDFYYYSWDTCKEYAKLVCNLK